VEELMAPEPEPEVEEQVAAEQVAAEQVAAEPSAVRPDAAVALSVRAVAA